MKEIFADEVLREIFKTKNICTAKDLNEFKKKYLEEHQFPEEDYHIDVSKDAVIWAVQTFPDEFAWKSSDTLTVIKQEIVYCPMCHTKHRKYPKIEEFDTLVRAKESFERIMNHIDDLTKFTKK